MKFRCLRCGECCSHIRGWIREEDKEFLKDYCYGKLPIIITTPIDKITFPIWDFETKKIIEAKEKLNLDIKLYPSRVVYDLNKDIVIVISYSINADSCPFLQEGKCLIYTRRVFVCKVFPFQVSPFLDTSTDLDGGMMFGACKAINEIINNFDYKNRNKLIKQLYDCFGETFLAAVQYDIVGRWINTTLMKLIKMGLRPALNYPYKYLVKRIEKAKKIDFTKYLITTQIYSRNQIEKLINKFTHYEDAKIMLKKFLR